MTTSPHDAMSVSDAGQYPAAYWKTVGSGNKAQCLLCPFNCVLAEGKTGVCNGKKNIHGKLWAINYGLTTAIHVDPVEKKPLYHFHPGSDIFSIGPNGCNMRCDFCQNYRISQQEFPVTALAPEEAVSMALSTNSTGIAYTYTEPMIWFEYVMQTARLARRQGLFNALVTNGMINPEPLDELLPRIDAMNVDIKSMDPAFYKKTCRGMLDPVLNTVRRSAESVHVEITNLIIPGLNDADYLFEQIADFIAGIDDMIPLHFSRYHPDYKQTAPPTPLKTMERAARIAGRKLKHVFIGNVAVDSGSRTHCPSCGKVIIERAGYSVLRVATRGGKCEYCGSATGVVTE